MEQMSPMEKYQWYQYESIGSLKYQSVSRIGTLVAQSKKSSYWFNSTFTKSIFPVEQVVPAAVRVVRTERIQSVLFAEEDFCEYDISDLIDSIVSSPTLKRVQFFACRFSTDNKNKILQFGMIEPSDEFYELITIEPAKVQWDRTINSIPVEFGGAAYVVNAWMRM